MSRVAALRKGLAGYATTLPTPFADGQVDEKAFSAFCEWQVAQHVAAVVVAGPTGEASTLVGDEYRHLVRLAVAATRGFTPVIAGVVANATDTAIELAKAAEEEGADAALVVAPYYNRPNQDGLYRHFQAVHDAVGIPLVLHNVPSRTGSMLAVPTVARLAALPRIAGLCDASDDLTRPLRLRLLLGNDFLLLGGDDALALAFLAHGGDGCMSVLSNIVPRLCVHLHDDWASGNNLVAQAAALALTRLNDALSLESDPGPLKHALCMLGWMKDELRLPLHPAAEPTRKQVAAALADLGLLSPRACGEAASIEAGGGRTRRWMGSTAVRAGSPMEFL